MNSFFIIIWQSIRFIKFHAGIATEYQKLAYQPGEQKFRNLILVGQAIFLSSTKPSWDLMLLDETLVSLECVYHRAMVS